ncbi:hypothetical protein PSY31_23290, partial [Shigella flexneri]|nr:hypothetical protein [Shigella flexneri]
MAFAILARRGLDSIEKSAASKVIWSVAPESKIHNVSRGTELVQNALPVSEGGFSGDLSKGNVGDASAIT